jgi:hypothetical protein
VVLRRINVRPEIEAVIRHVVDNENGTPLTNG